MSDFNGMVSVDKIDVEIALSNYEKAKVAAKSARTSAVMIAKLKIMSVPHWFFFKKEITQWQNICDSAFWMGRYYYLQRLYPEVFTEEQYNLTQEDTRVDNLASLVKIKTVNAVYLTPWQSQFVFNWSNPNE